MRVLAALSIVATIGGATYQDLTDNDRVESACEDRADCAGCVSEESCSWCASERRCMDMSEIFTSDCHGTIFDAPCPSSLIPETRIVGDFILEPDGRFGGGHLLSAGADFEFLISDEAVKLISASDVSVDGGSAGGVNAAGGALMLGAGAGNNQLGAGGEMYFSAGSGAGSSPSGGEGLAGTTQVVSGGACEGVGGGLAVLGGGSSHGAGGRVMLITGHAPCGHENASRRRRGYNGYRRCVEWSTSVKICRNGPAQ